MNKADKELLELAAKAIGMKTTLLPSVAEPDRPYERPWEIEDSEWNPLEYGGDALRLAVKLGINLYSFKESFAAANTRLAFSEKHDCDPYRAACRAIVRAAAAIGEKM